MHKVKSESALKQMNNNRIVQNMRQSSEEQEMLPPHDGNRMKNS